MTKLFPALFVLLLTACGPQKAPDFPEPESLPIIQLRDGAPEEVKFGQPVELHLRISANERLALPPPEDWLEEPVELLDSQSTETKTETGWQRNISLTVAVYAVTNTPVFVSTPLLDSPEPTLPFHTLQVTTRLEGEDASVPKFGSDELPDFRGSEALRRRNRNLWISAGVALFLIALLLFLAWRWRNRVIPPPPPIPAHRKAEKALEQLRGDPIWTTPNVDASAVALSLILRTYIEDRFGIQAPDLTTEEFLLSVEQEAPWPEEKQAGLKRFFTATDRIKFAGDRPEREVLDELMSSVEEFIASTKQEVAA